MIPLEWSEEGRKRAFMARVEFEPNTGCLLWSGAPGAGGYGVVGIDGRYYKAHRVSWAIHHGVMPPSDMKVCHSCDTPPCVNPDHLWLGTQADNVADMMAKHRNGQKPRFGSTNSMAVLDEERVCEIRSLLKLANFTQRDIAKSYGVSPMTISRIAHHQLWPQVHLGWPLKPYPLILGKAA